VWASSEPSNIEVWSFESELGKGDAVGTEPTRTAPKTGDRPVSGVKSQVVHIFDGPIV
jgi:hypothetical protein